MKKLQFTAAVTAAFLLLAPAAAFADDGDAPNPHVIQTAPVSSPADTGIAVTINNIPLDLTGLHPYRDGENVMIPVRKVAETLGFEITWTPYGYEDRGDIHLFRDDRIAGLYPKEIVYYRQILGQDEISIPFELPVTPIIHEGTTYVPAELFNTLLDNSNTVIVSGDVVYINTDKEPESDPNAELPNPWTAYATLVEAQEAVGFELNLPETLLGDEYKIEYIGVLNSENMAQVTYQNGAGAAINYRKATAGQISDISGFFGDFETGSQTYKDQTIQTKSENGNIIAAYWYDGKAVQSVSFSPEGADSGTLEEVLSAFILN